MSSEFNQKQLEAILDQCCVSGELRYILAKEGIPECEPTTLSIKCVDNDMEVITDYEIPTTSPEVSVPPTECDFEREIKDLIDQCENSHNFLSELPKSDSLPDGSTKTSFNLSFKSPIKKIDVLFATCCTWAGCANC
ncbi:MAG: hypothetical protein WBM62_12410 [Crocosphaera sp.]|jgi:hypothetical protein